MTQKTPVAELAGVWRFAGRPRSPRIDGVRAARRPTGPPDPASLGKNYRGSEGGHAGGCRADGVAVRAVWRKRRRPVVARPPHFAEFSATPLRHAALRATRHGRGARPRRRWVNSAKLLVPRQAPPRWSDARGRLRRRDQPMTPPNIRAELFRCFLAHAEQGS